MFVVVVVVVCCCCCCCGGCCRGGGGGGSGGEGCVVETRVCCGSCMYIRNNPPRTVAQGQKGRSVATSDACVSVGSGTPWHCVMGDGVGMLAMDLGKLGGMAQGLCLVE